MRLPFTSLVQQLPSNRSTVTSLCYLQVSVTVLITREFHKTFCSICLICLLMLSVISYFSCPDTPGGSRECQTCIRTGCKLRQVRILIELYSNFTKNINNKLCFLHSAQVTDRNQRKDQQHSTYEQQPNMQEKYKIFIKESKTS